ncbi:MAG TPA: phosphodiester glycosidase family protein [Anaerolineae bacterium]
MEKPAHSRRNAPAPNGPPVHRTGHGLGRQASQGWLALRLSVLVILSACDSTVNAASPFAPPDAPLLPTRTLSPTSTPIAAPTRPPLSPTPTLIPTVPAVVNGWQEVRSGVQVREMFKDPKTKEGRALVVRIDPGQVDFHVRYQPEQPLHVSEWYSNSQALIVMNSSFFDGANRAVGHIVSDGVGDGQWHSWMDGAFYLTAVGAAVWPLQGWQKPPGLEVVEAIESFPMLLMPGGLVNSNIGDEPRAARRTVVAVDRSGYVLFIVTPSSVFTLHGMAIWLANSDLNLDTALNFDGGSSSGLAVWTPTGMWGLDSANKVPAVITVDIKVLGVTGPDGGEWP